MEAILHPSILKTGKSQQISASQSREGMKRRMSLEQRVSTLFDNEQQAEKQRKGVHWPVSILMQQAITDGDVAEIRDLIHEYGNKVVLENEPSGLPPVMRAVFEEELESLRLLVESGADLTAQDPEGWNVMHVASAMDDLEAAKFVLASCNESLTSAHNADGQRPIDLAESVEMARLLLDADLNELRIETENAQKSDLVTTEAAILTLVRESYEKNADCESLNQVLRSSTEFDTLLHFAASKNYPRLAKFVLKHQIVETDFRDAYGWTALHTATEYSHIDVVLVLIQYGASVHVLTNSYEKATDLAEHELIQHILREEENVENV